MRKIFSLLLCLMLFGPAAARAIDIEGYLPSEVNARARWIDVDGSYTVALEAQMEADAPRRLVRYDADGGVVYDIVLPDVEGNMPEGGVSKIYRLPDGRDALLFLTGAPRQRDGRCGGDVPASCPYGGRLLFRAGHGPIDCAKGEWPRRYRGERDRVDGLGGSGAFSRGGP